MENKELLKVKNVIDYNKKEESRKNKRMRFLVKRNLDFMEYLSKSNSEYVSNKATCMINDYNNILKNCKTT